MESLKYLDDLIINHLNSLYVDNLLKDSSIFLLSDHEDGMPLIYYLTDFYQYEVHLPLLFLLINDRKI